MTEPAITEHTIVVVSDGAPLPAWLDTWLVETADAVLSCADSESVMSWALRARPRAIVLDGRCATTDSYALCGRLKRDSWTAIVPIVVLEETVDYAHAFGCGADEVLSVGMGADEASARLTALLRRSDRDTDVHPSTRLPGAREIEAELGRRMARHEVFAACYADLDHFKEFNDRYGFHEGNEVIRLVARLLHDVVKGLCGESGFVGHIGGDDFLYIVPIVAMPRVCDEVIRVFDELAPLQYSEADRRAGYFLGKDRRNQLYRVPLMTLSVGVVTNQHRRFGRPAEVSELATEMKSYAKTLAGSVWTLDRRRDDDPAEEAREQRTREAVQAPVAATGGGATVLPMRPRHAR
jgi:diguanylate cyclase (GGDEF)-like protein